MKKIINFFIGVTAFFIALQIPFISQANTEEVERLYTKQEVDTYRNEGSYPTKTGYVFAGWYMDAQYCTPVKEETPENGAYPKFVDEKVLSIKFQLHKDVLKESKSTDMRLITTVDSKKYKEVRMYVKAGNKEADLKSTTVYQTLRGYVDGQNQSFTPNQVFDNEDSLYFMTKNLINISRSEFTNEFQVTPYWTTLDGTEVKGIERTIVINKNVYAPDELGFIAGTGADVQEVSLEGETVAEVALDQYEHVYFKDVLEESSTRGKYFDYNYQYVVFDMKIVSNSGSFLFNTSGQNIWTNGNGYPWFDNLIQDTTLKQGDYLVSYKEDVKNALNTDGWYTVRMKVDNNSTLGSISNIEQTQLKIYLKNLRFTMDNKVEELTVENIKEGGSPNPTASTFYGGNVAYLYATEKEGTYLPREQFDFGPYYVKAVTEETVQYGSGESEPTLFNVGKFTPDPLGFVAGDGTSVETTQKDGKTVVKATIPAGKNILFKDVTTDESVPVKGAFFNIDYREYKYVTFDMFIESSTNFLFNTSGHNIWTNAAGYDWRDMAAGSGKQGDYLRTYTGKTFTPLNKGAWYTVSMCVESYTNFVSVQAESGNAVIYLKNLRFEKEFPNTGNESSDVIVGDTTYQDVPKPDKYHEIQDMTAYTTYYFDSFNGDDENDGLNESSPKKSVEAANAIIAGCRAEQPIRILFKAGSSYSETLQVGSFLATETAPLLIDVYGVTEGNMYAKFEVGAGKDCVVVTGSNVRISGLELTGTDANRGFYVHPVAKGAMKNIVLKGNYIHNVNDNNNTASEKYHRHYGGIYFAADTSKTDGASWFEDIWVEDNKVSNVSRIGIFVNSNWVKRPGIDWGHNHYYDDQTGWYPHHNVNILNNNIEYAGGDAIIILAVNDGFIQGNRSVYAHYRGQADTYSAAIWLHSCDNVVIQFNEAAHTYLPTGSGDGQGFDIDIGNTDILFQYNYSHDNAGGGLLICNKETKDVEYNVDGINVGETSRYSECGTITVRNNVFADNKDTAFHIQGPIRNVSITNNTVVIPGENAEQGIVRTNQWGEMQMSDSSLEFTNNIFYLRNKNTSKFDVCLFQNVIIENNIFYNFADEFLSTNNIDSTQNYDDVNPELENIVTLDGYENMNNFIPNAKECYENGKLLSEMAKEDSAKHSAVSVKYIGAIAAPYKVLGFVAGDGTTLTTTEKDNETVIKAEMTANSMIYFQDVKDKNGSWGNFKELGYSYVTFDMFIESSENFLFNTSTHGVWTNGQGFDWSSQSAGSGKQSDFVRTYLDGTQGWITTGAWYTVSMRVEDYSQVVSVQSQGDAVIYLKNLRFANAFPQEKGQPDTLGFKVVDPSGGSTMEKITTGDFANTMKFTANSDDGEWSNKNRVAFDGMDCSNKTGLFYEQDWNRVEFEVYFDKSSAVVPVCGVACWWSSFGHGADDMNLWSYLTVTDVNGNVVKNITKGQWYKFSFSKVNASEICLGFGNGGSAYFKNLRFTK